jgi:apolipoprotein D and lipocalin family protein
MHRIALIAALALAACARAPGPALRDPAAPIFSAAAFDPTRLVGTWTQAADQSLAPAGCAGGAVTFAPAPQGLGVEGLAVEGRLCLNGQDQAIAGALGRVGPGRLAVPGQADWWVLWVDEGYRTLVIGTPSGAFGFVLDRGRLPADRLAAAVQVFDLNGYPAATLRRLGEAGL